MGSVFPHSVSRRGFFSPRGIGGPLLLLLLCALVQLSSVYFSQWPLYDRAAIAGGQFWRLLSGHLLHSNGAHLLLNIGGLIALWLLHGQHYRAAGYLGLTSILALLIGSGLWLWFAEVEEYCGLSGVLHGLFAWGACHDLKRRWQSGALLLAGCYLKITWELLAGPSAATAALIEAEVAVSSHLLGAVAGTAIGLLGLLRMRTIGRAKKLHRQLH
jgi:rhomboid family GlyGly-CTERM serine protease